MKLKDAIIQYGSMRRAAIALDMSFVSFKHKYRQEEGLCTRCGEKPEDGKLCDKCKAEYRGRHKEGMNRSKATKICVNCGKEYHPFINARYNSRFCSRSCRCSYCNRGENNPMYLNGESKRKYPGIFYKARKLVFERDEYICQLCHKHRTSPAAHHIDYNKDNNDLSNLITLCNRCHAKTGGTQENRDYWIKYFQEHPPRGITTS